MESYVSTAAEQLIQALRAEIESLKSTVEFLSGIQERNAESGALQNDELLKLADQQRMLMEKVREVIEHQQQLHAWVMANAVPAQASPVVQQPAPLDQRESPTSEVPNTLPLIHG